MKQLDTQTPVNFKTGKTYPHETSELLKQAAKQWNYGSNEWATLKQWNTVNEVVPRGQKAFKISFVNKKGEEVNAFLFNRSQLEQ